MTPGDRKKPYPPRRGATENPKIVAVATFILSALFLIPGLWYLGFAPGVLPYDFILVILGIAIWAIGFAFYIVRFILERI